MVERPERRIEDFAEAGADSIAVHWEATPHVNYALQAVRDAGLNAGSRSTRPRPPEAVAGVARRPRPRALHDRQPRLGRPGVHRHARPPRSRACASCSARTCRSRWTAASTRTPPAPPARPARPCSSRAPRSSARADPAAGLPPDRRGGGRGLGALCLQQRLRAGQPATAIELAPPVLHRHVHVRRAGRRPCRRTATALVLRDRPAPSMSRHLSCTCGLPPSPRRLTPMSSDGRRETVRSPADALEAEAGRARATRASAGIGFGRRESSATSAPPTGDQHHQRDQADAATPASIHDRNLRG